MTITRYRNGEGNGNPLSTLAWKIPWMEEPGRLQSVGSKSWTRLSDFTFTLVALHCYVNFCCVAK